jgi:DNA-binding transcriptional MerR regulator
MSRVMFRLPHVRLTIVHGLLSIGQFSQIARLSVRTLRRYDEQGLLLPAMVDTVTNRRYYSPAQAGDARTIRLLRDLDVPLAQVRALVGELTPEAAGRRLREHRDHLADDLVNRQRVLAELDTLIEDLSTLTHRPVERRSVDEQIIVSVRRQCALEDIGLVVGDAATALFAHLRNNLAYPVGPLLTIYPGDEFDPAMLDVEIALPIGVWVRAGHEVAVRVVPRFEALCTLHLGPYTGIGDAYEALGRAADGQGLVLGADPREVHLVGPDRADPQELRTEVLWPLA